jgi:hypothetical protein
MKPTTRSTRKANAGGLFVSSEPGEWPDAPPCAACQSPEHKLMDHPLNGEVLLADAHHDLREAQIEQAFRG